LRAGDRGFIVSRRRVIGALLSLAVRWQGLYCLLQSADRGFIVLQSGDKGFIVLQSGDKGSIVLQSCDRGSIVS